MNIFKNINSKNLQSDLQSGLVVFLVALPLCLGIALASGAPLFAGVIAGAIGGIIIGSLSGSHVSVAGPAAGLTAIVFTSIATLSSFETFILAVFLAGIFQIILGYLKAGSISNYFPSNVIEGMLTAIGIIIILKQIPVGLGFNLKNEGIFFSFSKKELDSFFIPLGKINSIHFGSVIVLFLGLFIQIFWNKIQFLKNIKSIPAALIAVVAGTVLNEIFLSTNSRFALDKDFLVSLPSFSSISDALNFFSVPNFSEITNIKVWEVAATIAIVASIETLLSIDAADKLDLQKRLTDTNRELKAQGVGNLLSGLIGGLPVTSVIVRTSANITSGAKSKFSSIFHGILLFLSVLFIPGLLNKIPLASLASILFLIGYKLASPKVFKKVWNSGVSQFAPFIITVMAVVFTDLLIGVMLGLFISVSFILHANLQFAYRFRKDQYNEGEVITIQLGEQVTFLNKAAIKQTLMDLPADSQVIIDSTNNVYLDHDVIQLIKDFLHYGSKEKNIHARLKGFRAKHKMDDFNHLTIE
jgi:MFS superfamily sulfate permease-like transporter